jgi:hypothetical protein
MLEALLTKSCLLANLLVWAPMLASDLGPGHALLPHLGLRSEAPAKIALLVGIDRYAPGTSTGFAKLQGCVQDVRMVEAPRLRLLINGTDMAVQRRLQPKPFLMNLRRN